MAATALRRRAEAAEIAAALVLADGGGRWRVYGMRSVPARGGAVRLERAELLAEGVALLPRDGDP